MGKNAWILLKVKCADLLSVTYTIVEHTIHSNANTKKKTTITIELPIHSAICHLYGNVANADILDVRVRAHGYFLAVYTRIHK